MTKKSFLWVGEVGQGQDWVRYWDMRLYQNLLPTEGIRKYHPADIQAITDEVEKEEVIVYLAVAHGGPKEAVVRTVGGEMLILTVADHIGPAMDRRTQPMKFVFISHSEGMKETGAGTWSHAFRKGQPQGCAVVGVSGGMSTSNWLDFQLIWSPAFFTYVHWGFKFKLAFRMANFVCPTLRSKMVFDGDENMSTADLT